MIRLNLPKEPYWLDIVAGARVEVNPLTSAVYAAAKAKAFRAADELRDQRAAVVEAGGTVTDFPDLDDPDVVQGLVDMILTQALAVSGIRRWEGIGDDGAPAPVTEENVKAFAALPRIGELFLLRYLAPMIEVGAEGNASGPGPNGTSAAGPTTAGGAGNKASPARKGKRPKGGGAPTKRTGRARSRARRPGAS